MGAYSPNIIANSFLSCATHNGDGEFIIFGDRTGGPRSGLKILEQAVEDTNLLDPDFVMTVGDLVQGYNAHEPWLMEMREYRAIMKGLTMKWFPVAGNHDVYWRGSPPPPGQHESNYEKHFGPLWYWFPHKNAAFVVLYTDEDDANGRKGFGMPGANEFSEKQLAWVEKTLTETVEAIIEFETAVGSCSGVLRLLPNPGHGGAPTRQSGG